MITEEIAATAAGFLALSFVAEPETWSVFKEWARRNADVPLLAERHEVEHLKAVMAARMRKESR